jgi:hypothetical protein
MFQFSFAYDMSVKRRVYYTCDQFRAFLCVYKFVRSSVVQNRMCIDRQTTSISHGQQ